MNTKKEKKNSVKGVILSGKTTTNENQNRETRSEKDLTHFVSALQNAFIVRTDGYRIFCLVVLKEETLALSTIFFCLSYIGVFLGWQFMLVEINLKKL